jgi:ribonuclease P protein component
MALQTLRKNSQFRTCYARGRKVVCDHAIIFYHTNPDANGLRIGFVASKRVGGAVTRNRAKRLLREAARGVADKWNNGDLWIVLVARSSISAASSKDVQNDIERRLARAGLLAENIK